MRIKHMQHTGDRAVVNGFVGINRVGVVLFNQAVNLGESLDVFTDFSVFAGLRSALAKNDTQEAAKDQKRCQKNERTDGIALHGRYNLQLPDGSLTLRQMQIRRAIDEFVTCNVLNNSTATALKSLKNIGNPPVAGFSTGYCLLPKGNGSPGGG